MTEPVPACFAALDALLTEERDLLVHGRFADLPGLIDRKAGLVDGLAAAAGPGDAPILDGLRNRADANAQLMNASLAGLRAAGRRIDMILRAGHSLETYDRLGKSGTISTAAPGVERRA
jgi:hypothetical protein